MAKGSPFFLRKANHSNHRIGAHTGANQTVPYGTALLRWRFPGTLCQATVGPSLRDWGKAPSGNKSSQIFLNLVPFNPRLCPVAFLGPPRATLTSTIAVPKRVMSGDRRILVRRRD